MSRRKSHKQFLEDVKKLVGDEYEVIGRYELSNTPVKMYHIECGKEFKVIPNNFLRRGTCPACSQYKRQIDYEKEVDKTSEGRYEVISEYKGSREPIEIRCRIHGETFTRNANVILRGNNSCPKCKGETSSKKQLKPEKEFIQELYDRHEGTITAMERYSGTHSRILFRCNICKTNFKTEPNAVLRISGCPTCAEPKGEREIREYLDRRGIKYKSQVRFEECSYVRPLVFDYYLPEKNTLIEYDGLQHYKPIEYFGGSKAYREQRTRDRIKDKYAKDYSKRLIRIPYTITGDSIWDKLDRELGCVSPKLGSNVENLQPK